MAETAPTRCDTNTIAPLLTVTETAEVLRISTRSLHTITERGDLRCVRVGHRKLYRPADVEAYIARCLSGVSR